MRLRWRRSVVAFGLGATLGLSGLTGPGASWAVPPAAETGPGPELVVNEVTLAAPPHSRPAVTELYMAGTGLLMHRPGTTSYQWWEPSTGRTAPYPACARDRAVPRSGDTVACLELRDTTAAAYVVHDMSDGAVRSAVRPEGHQWTMAHSATHALTSVANAEDTEVGLHLVGLGEGVPADIPVKSPVAIPRHPTIVAFDTWGAYLRYWENQAGWRYGVVDFATATFRPAVSNPDLPPYPQYALSKEWVVQYDGSRDPFFLTSRTDGTTTRTRTVPSPTSGSGVAAQVIGDWLVTAYGASTPLVATSLSTGERRTLLPGASMKLVTASDGTLYVDGGSDSTQWGVQHITLDEQGVPRTERVLETPPDPAQRSGLALAQGQLAFRQDDGREARLFGYELSTTSPTSLSREPVWSCDAIHGNALCAADEGGSGESETALDDAPVATGDGRFVAMSSQDDGITCFGCVTVLHVREAAEGGVTRAVRIKTGSLKPSRILGASGRYVQVLASQNYLTKMVVFDIDTGRIVRAGTALESLSGGRVWAKKGPLLTPVDLATGAESAPVDTGSTCAPARLQVTGDWASVFCSDYTSEHVLVNLRTKERFALAQDGGLNDASRLGEGYVVTPTAEGLDLVDVRSGTPVRQRLTTGTVPHLSYGRSLWALDPYTDTVAYLDGGHTVRILALNRPARQTVVTDHAADAEWNRQSGRSWHGTWWFSGPVASWRLTLTDKANGNVIRTFEGGPARGRADAQWDGKRADGQGAAKGTYAWAMTAVPADGQGSRVQESGELAVTGAAGAYRPVTPTRLLDTRAGLGSPKAKVGPGGTVTLDVSGRGGVPASGVSAVVLNVTAVDASSPTFVAVHPAAEARTSASNLNVVPGRALSNSVVVPTSAGKVSFYNRAGTVDLIADVAGYYTDNAEGARFKPSAPFRAMDTRSGIGVRKAKVGTASTVSLQVTGRGGVPASGVSAVVMNVTATNVTASTFVSVYPSGTVRTSASSLNATAGRTVPNLVLVPVVDGKVVFYNHGGSVDLLADVAGYYSTSGEGALFQPLTPTRIMDSRERLGIGDSLVGPGTAWLPVAGRGGVPATGVSAVVMNVTATDVSASTFVSVYPDGTARSAASNLNPAAGQTVPNLVVVPLGTDGGVSLYNHAGLVNLLGDVAGYFVG